MKVKIYSVRDRKTGEYAHPFISHNDETAKRDFWTTCNANKNPFVHTDDWELYGLGDFNTESGEVLGADKPIFILDGGSMNV